MIARIVGIAAFAALAAFGLHETRATGERDPVPAPATSGPEDEPEAAAAGVTDVDRYCHLIRQLDRATAGFLREHRADSRRELERAGRAFLREQAAALEEVQDVAPDRIRDDTRTFVQVARAFLRGEQTGPTTAGERAAERRLAGFERKSCR
jgi:hypothetical protein